METVKVSPKFQVVIPLRVRAALALTPGQMVRVIQHGQRVEFIPIVPVRKARGFLKGINTSIEREADRA